MTDKSYESEEFITQTIPNRISQKGSILEFNELGFEELKSEYKIVSAFHQAGVIVTEKEGKWPTTADNKHTRAVQGMEHEKLTIPDSMRSTLSIT